jgi:hypothetical protein
LITVFALHFAQAFFPCRQFSCESFLGAEHRQQIEKEAVEIVSEVLKNA